MPRGVKRNDGIRAQSREFRRTGGYAIKNITLPKRVVDLLDAFCKLSGLSRSKAIVFFVQSRPEMKFDYDAYVKELDLERK